MSYIQQSLLKSEKIIFASRPHTIVFGPSIMILLAAFLIWMYLPDYIGYTPPVWRSWHVHEILALAIFLYGIYSLLQSLLFYQTSEYGITDKRIIMKRGFIERNTVEIFLQRIEAVNVQQSVLGRLLNYGTVIVIGTGGSSDFYSYIPDPVQFRRLVQQEMDKKLDSQ